MENINFQTQQPTNFLPVCHYILSFGMFLYNQNLISLDKRNHSTCILDAFFKYIHNSENEYKMKVYLLEKAQKESPLYDNVKNIKLDVKYVDATYQHIISTALFSQYGNINGYLATIIHTVSDVTYNAFKEKVLQHFSKNFVCSDYCSSRNEDYLLSPLAIEKVFKENIWSMFPEPDENMMITDVNYIYAMIGSRIFKSIQSDIVNLPFDNYILLSQAIEFQTFDNETLYFVLELFATPALLYFSYTEKGKIFHEYTNSSILSSSTLWQKVYHSLFIHFNFKKTSILGKEFNNNILFSRLHSEFYHLISKSSFEKVYKKCPNSFTDYLTHYVYQIFSTSFQTINQNKCNESRSAKIDARYNAQFDPIKEIVTQLVQNSLEQIVLQSNILKTLTSNATVKLVQVLNNNKHCIHCVPTQKKENRGIYILFAIIDNKKRVFYSIKQENYTLTLLANGRKKRKLAKKLQDPSLKMKNPILNETLKYRNEDYKVFIMRLTKIITYEFVQELKTQGNDLDDIRFTEVKQNTLNSLVPFYTCIDTIEIDSEKKTSISCNIVVNNFHSINPPENSPSMWDNFITILGQQILPNILKSDIRESKFEVIWASALEKVIPTLTMEIAKNIQRNVNYVPMQIKEPAFELSFQVSAHSNQVLQKITRTLSTRFPSIQKFQNLLLSIESTMKIFNENEKVLQDKISQTSNATGKPINKKCLISAEDY